MYFCINISSDYIMRLGYYLLLLFSLSVVGCTQNRDYSGIKYSYQLPDGMVFTIWEKELGREILIIPGKHYGNEEPKVSYIKTEYSFFDIWLFYTLNKNSINYNFLKNRIIVKISTEKRIEIVNMPDSPWDIVNISEENSRYIYYYDIDSTKHIRSDISYFNSTITMPAYTSFFIGQELPIRPIN